eukprot:TRINITY_DN796_c0_g1_i10.p1 TRINITY_DN796_c0_g1~~TRINITY_DN796_c0_g1_i10.p1  ORF type:complete len:167 (-),score=45.60 TRINITY_DN796_c0_g1_i10:122-622(-)
MEQECLSLHVSKRNVLQSKIRRYRLDLEEQRKKFNKCEESFWESRMREGGIDEEEEKKTELRSRLLNVNDRMENHVGRLGNVNRVAVETEMTMTEMATNLRGHREVIIHGLEETKETSSLLNRTNRIITLLHNKEYFNKAILMLVIAMLFLIDILIFYIKFLKRRH